MPGDLDVLGAVLFALVAPDAVPSLGMSLSQIVVVDHLGGHVAVLKQGEILRDGDVLGALHRAVAAARAGDGEFALDDLRRLGAEAFSSSFMGRKSFMVWILSSSCSMLFMPESTIITPSWLAANRRAQLALEAAGA